MRNFILVLNQQEKIYPPQLIPVAFFSSTSTLLSSPKSSSLSICFISDQFIKLQTIELYNKKMSNDAYQEEAANLNESIPITSKGIKFNENAAILGVIGVFCLSLLTIFMYRNIEVEVDPLQIKEWNDKMGNYHKWNEAKTESQQYQVGDLQIVLGNLNKAKAAVQQKSNDMQKQKDYVSSIEMQTILKQREVLNILRNDQQYYEQIEIESDKKDDEKKKKEEKEGKTKQEQRGFPRNVWRYSSVSPNKIFSLIEQNVEFYSVESGFKFTSIKPQSQLAHLSKEAQGEIIKRANQPHLKQFASISSVLKYFLIKLYTLKEKGGIWIDPNVFLYEGLEWIYSLDSNPYVINKHGTPAEVFSFYQSPTVFGLPRDQLSQYYVAPKIDNSFIVAVKNSKLITDWLSNYLQLQAKMSEDCRLHGKIPNDNDYGQLYWNAVAAAIKSKQTQNTHGVHYYGLRMMLDRYHAYKLRQVTQLLQHRQLDFMTQVSVQYAQEMSGPLRYIQELSYEFIDLISKETSNLNDFSRIVLDRNSILSTYLLRTNSSPTVDILEQEIISQQKFNFPHVVWVYWGTGYEGMDMIHALCLVNIKHYTRLSGYQLRLLDDSNVMQYISEEGQQKIQYALKEAKLKTSLATKSDLVRLAILYEHGGIYLDQTIILCQSFNWLENIHKSRYVIGSTSLRAPQVFFWFNTQHQMHQFSPTMNKLIISPGFESYFIAAVPKAQFIKQCRQMHIDLLTHDQQYYKGIIDRQGYIVRGSLRELPYFIIMTGFQFVMQGKQKQLDASMNQRNSLSTNSNPRDFKYAMHYYGMITMDVKCGPYHVQLNAFTYEYSDLVELLALRTKQYVEGIFGKFKHFIKLHHQNIGPVGSKVKEITKDKLTTTKGSFIEKHLLLLQGSEDIIGYQWK